MQMIRPLKALGCAVLLSACNGAAPKEHDDMSVEITSVKDYEQMRIRGRTPPSQAQAPQTPDIIVTPLPRTDPTGTGEEIQLGMTRMALVEKLGRCGQRVALMPGGKRGKTVEVIQPLGDDCVKRFGSRNFRMVAGTLHSIEDGLLNNEQPVSRPPTDR